MIYDLIDVREEMEVKMECVERRERYVIRVEELVS